MQGLYVFDAARSIQLLDSLHPVAFSCQHDTSLDCCGVAWQKPVVAVGTLAVVGAGSEEERLVLLDPQLCAVE